MRFELWQIDNYISIYHIPRNQVLMPVMRVCICHQARIVTSNSKRMLVIRYGFQQAVFHEIKKHETIFINKVFGCDSHPMHKVAGGPAKIMNSLETRVLLHYVARPEAKTGHFKEFFKMTALYRRVANFNFGRA